MFPPNKMKSTNTQQFSQFVVESFWVSTALTEPASAASSSAWAQTHFQLTNKIQCFCDWSRFKEPLSSQSLKERPKIHFEKVTSHSRTGPRTKPFSSSAFWQSCCFPFAVQQKRIRKRTCFCFPGLQVLTFDNGTSIRANVCTQPCANVSWKLVFILANFWMKSMSSCVSLLFDPFFSWPSPRLLNVSNVVIAPFNIQSWWREFCWEKRKYW